jgi:dipeptidase E
MHIAFVPFAAVRLSYDEYTRLVRERLESMGHTVTSLHETSNPIQVVEKADAIMIGGGNTFHLLTGLYDRNLLEPIRIRCLAGTPYIGWSAGSNVAGPTIRTTNDMPIVQPPSFDALNLVPFQMNPHYTNAMPKGLRAETRDDRLMEFIEVNREVNVVGLPEGTLLHVEGDSINYIGETSAVLFHYGTTKRELNEKDDISFLLS